MTSAIVPSVLTNTTASGLRCSGSLISPHRPLACSRCRGRRCRPRTQSCVRATVNGHKEVLFALEGAREGVHRPAAHSVAQDLHFNQVRGDTGVGTPVLLPVSADQELHVLSGFWVLRDLHECVPTHLPEIELLSSDGCGVSILLGGRRDRIQVQELGCRVSGSKVLESASLCSMGSTAWDLVSFYIGSSPPRSLSSASKCRNFTRSRRITSPVGNENTDHRLLSRSQGTFERERGVMLFQHRFRGIQRLHRFQQLFTPSPSSANSFWRNAIADSSVSWLEATSFYFKFSISVLKRTDTAVCSSTDAVRFKVRLSHNVLICATPT